MPSTEATGGPARRQPASRSPASTDRLVQRSPGSRHRGRQSGCCAQLAIPARVPSGRATDSWAKSSPSQPSSSQRRRRICGLRKMDDRYGPLEDGSMSNRRVGRSRLVSPGAPAASAACCSPGRAGRGWPPRHPNSFTWSPASARSGRTVRGPRHPGWQPGQVGTAAAGGADRRSAMVLKILSTMLRVSPHGRPSHSAETRRLARHFALWLRVAYDQSSRSTREGP